MSCLLSPPGELQSPYILVCMRKKKKRQTAKGVVRRAGQCWHHLHTESMAMVRKRPKLTINALQKTGLYHTHAGNLRVCVRARGASVLVAFVVRRQPDACKN
jgi:hypothetical protein